MDIRSLPRIISGLSAVLFILALSPASASERQQPGDDAIWESFKSWILGNPPEASLEAFGKELAAEGASEDEVERRLQVLRRIFSEQPEKGVEVTYDRIFSKPLTGDPAKDGFTSTPSVFMMESVKGLTPGRALDVGTGQGRNAVWLAQQGWDVTGIDLSEAGLAAARANAEKVGVGIQTVHTSYADFDFGTEQWDLIVMILSWAPVADPDFVARLHRSLRDGGVVVFEHVLETEKQSFPPVVRALPPNALRAYFSDFSIQKYDEGVWLGDWGGPPAELVRMIAAKNRR